jgi:hypothetical protein
MRAMACCLFALLLLGSTAILPAAHADVWNQKTRFTFSQPVEIPGRILPAGTYWFNLSDSLSDRQVVEIYNRDWSRIYATILTVPAWRARRTGRTELNFAERPQNQPEAVLTWFYPGMQIGHEFVYPNRQEHRLQRDTQEEMLVPRAGAANSAPIVLMRRGE